MQAYLARLAEDLGEVLVGATSIEHVIEHWRARGLPELATLLSRLERYASDAAARARDPERREMQESELRRLVALLDLGLLDEAERISFGHRG